MNGDFSIFPQLDSFERKIGRLVEELRVTRLRITQMERERTALMQENADLVQTIQQQQQQLKQLQKKTGNPVQGFSKSTNFAKIVGDNHNEAETTAELKQKLEAYIGELDRCIAYLSDLSKS